MAFDVDNEIQKYQSKLDLKYREYYALKRTAKMKKVEDYKDQVSKILKKVFIALTIIGGGLCLASVVSMFLDLVVPSMICLLGGCVIFAPIMAQEAILKKILQKEIKKIGAEEDMKKVQDCSNEISQYCEYINELYIIKNDIENVEKNKPTIENNKRTNDKETKISFEKSQKPKDSQDFEEEMQP